MQSHACYAGRPNKRTALDPGLVAVLDEPEKVAFWPGPVIAGVCAVHVVLLGVRVPCPGKRGAEGQAKRKGVTVRWGLKEAWSEGAGRRTGTGYEVWYAWDEWARNHEVLHPQGGVLYKSGVSALTGVRLTAGDLVGVLGSGGPRTLTRRGGHSSDRARGVSRGQSPDAWRWEGPKGSKGSIPRSVSPQARPGLRGESESWR